MASPAAAARLSRLYGHIRDLLPGALAAPDPFAKGGTTVDPNWLPSPRRYVIPQPGRLDHWEAAASGAPFLFIDVATQPQLGLQIGTADGVRRLTALMEPAGRPRLAGLLDAAARFDEGAEAALLVVHRDARGHVHERVVDDRRLHTQALGPAVLAALLDGAARAAERLRGADQVALRLARVPVAEEDPVGVRREAKRLVALWRPVWGLPSAARPPASKAELDSRLASLYRRSLRLVAGRLGPPERAVLRVELRNLEAAYRDAGLVRPRLLDILTARMGLDPTSEPHRKQ